MEIRKIREEEIKEARNISSVCFEWNWSKDGADKTVEEYIRQLREEPPSKADAYLEDTWAAFTDEGEMTAAISVVPYEITFDGNTVPMAGIGGVCTYPQFRRQGAIRGMFGKILLQMYEDGILFSYLYPFSEAFYRKFGYERSGRSRRWDLELAQIPDYDYTTRGAMRLCKRAEEFPALKEAYGVFAGKHNLCVKRDDRDWSVFDKTDPYRQNRFLYYYERKAEGGGTECGGYFVFEQVQKNGKALMNCEEFIFRDLESLWALLSFARSFRSQYHMIRIQLPDTCSLEYFLPDYAKADSRSDSVRCRGMVRAVCVEKILWSAAYAGSGELAIRIIDPILAQNNGIFKLTYQDGKAVSVERAESGGTADLALPVNLFGAGIIGCLDAQEMEYRPDVEFFCDPKKAAGVFYRKSNWINNYF